MLIGVHGLKVKFTTSLLCTQTQTVRQNWSGKPCRVWGYANSHVSAYFMHS